MDPSSIASSMVTLGPGYESYDRNLQDWNLAKAGSSRSQKVEAQPQELKKRLDEIQNRDVGKYEDRQFLLGLGTTQYGLNGIRVPEFNLLEQAAVYDAEPLVRRAITRQINLWFKQEFRLTGKKKANVDYIAKRLKQIAFVTRIPTQELFRKVVRSLLKYSNAFVIILRDERLSGGRRYPGFPPPIAGLIPVTPLSMFPKFESGKLVRWCRLLNTQMYTEIPAEDVIHFKFDHEEDFIFGKPRLLGAIEDVAALRRMEESVEILVAKYLFPIYQLSVGSAEKPCQYYSNGQSELDAAKVMLQEMEQEGVLITSERHKLDVIGALDKAIDATAYLDHFKKRLYADLGISSVDMGDGTLANRNTADSISQNLKDLVIEDQANFAAQVQMKLFLPFFLEHPAGPSAINNYDSVRLSFYNVDLDNRVKYETHVLNLWNNEAITHDEMRDMLGQQPMTDEEWGRSQFEMIQVALLDAQADSQMEVVDKQIEAQQKEARTNAKLREKELELQNQQHMATLRSNERQTQKALEHPGAKPLVAVGTQGATVSAGGGPVGGGKTSSGSKPKPKAKAAGAKKPDKKPDGAGARATATKVQPENQHGKNAGPTKRKSSLEGGFRVVDRAPAGDHDLLGPRLAGLVDVLMACRDAAEAAEAVAALFPGESDRALILPVVDGAFRSARSRIELRAALVAASLPIAKRIEEEEE
jgi:hypothetical protein